VSKPRLLDLFCGAGGAAMGYHRAGFEVVGVDIKPQPHYPFRFIQWDALEYVAWNVADDFDAIHASPPCQAYSNAQRIKQNEHPDLVGPSRELLQAAGLPYIIENVSGAPLINPVRLEGQMFGLNTNRPRLFECSFPVEMPVLIPPPLPQAKMGRRPKRGEAIQVVGNFTDIDAGRAAMGIDWMTRRELSQAIPPAYTEYIGAQLLRVLEVQS
jgi:DNA (cytosine-5)-methyltransferase 1